MRNGVEGEVYGERTATGSNVAEDVETLGVPGVLPGEDGAEDNHQETIGNVRE